MFSLFRLTLFNQCWLITTPGRNDGVMEMVIALPADWRWLNSVGISTGFPQTANAPHCPHKPNHPATDARDNPQSKKPAQD
ncbi:hypothetical protein [Photorhabdus australis]|uniref:hypothetical protein n=2 Tax=Photorhabdus australis TaxID=286156 RepID=UPI001F0A911C|nr:hypothetical protein [Photorhabdus australis]